MYCCLLLNLRTEIKYLIWNYRNKARVNSTVNYKHSYPNILINFLLIENNRENIFLFVLWDKIAVLFFAVCFLHHFCFKNYSYHNNNILILNKMNLHNFKQFYRKFVIFVIFGVEIQTQ